MKCPFLDTHDVRKRTVGHLSPTTGVLCKKTKKRGMGKENWGKVYKKKEKCLTLHANCDGKPLSGDL